MKKINIMNKKLYLILGVLVVLFSSCSRCVECENDSYRNGTAEGGPYLEICADNFEDNTEYRDYIEYLEDELGYICKNDLLN